MDTKHGVTAIIFSEREGRRVFLLLHRVLNWRGWEFVKGGIDGNEKPEEAVFREIGEETGLARVEMVAALPTKASWTKNNMKYIYTPFIIRGDITENVNLEQRIIEHDACKWVEERDVAAMLTHEDNRKIFSEALELLSQAKRGQRK